MAVLGASFQIGRSALEAYQAALSIAGQNIANAGNPDYARQTGRLSALSGGPVMGGIRPGAGVELSRLRRQVDESLEARVRFSISQRSGAQAAYRNLNQIESLYGELSETDLSTGLTQFFGSFGSLQTTPTDMGQRGQVIASADAMVRSIHRLRTGLVQQVREQAAQATSAVQEASTIAAEIGSLNEQIVRQESDGVTVAGALRDRRDSRLRDLSEFMDIQTREQPGGSINVYVGSEPLVQFSQSRGLRVERELRGGLELASVRFGDTNAPVRITEGSLVSMSAAAVGQARTQLEKLDTLAGGIIYEVNRIHSSGAGLIGFESVSSTNPVRDPSAALNSAAAGLPFPVTNGTFIVQVVDGASGQTISRQINVDLDGIGTDTSLNDLAAQLSAVPGVTATAQPDGRLSISAGSGATLRFSDDSSGALAALGVGGFFTGTNAETIEIDPSVRSDPRRIAASASGATSDGTIAGRLARLIDSGSTSVVLGGRSVGDFQGDMVADLAIEAAGAQTAADASEAVYSGLISQREAVSGVNLDEEAINLTKYERAYQGAARYLTILGQMTDEILRLV